MAIEKCRECKLGNFPPIYSTTLFIDKNNDILMKSGGNLSKGDAREILSTYVPKARVGDMKVIIVWEGQFRTDAFELTTADDFDTYEKKLRDYIG